MKPIQYPMANYQQIPGILPPNPIREFRGINTYDPLSIPESFFTDMANLSTDNFPVISTRPGFSVLGSAIGTKVLGIGVWKDQELHAVFNDGTWRKWTGSSWQTLKSGLSTTAEWSFTNFQGGWTDINLVGANGVNGLHRYDGSTVQTFGDAPSDINFITTYQNRLWGASKKTLHASALDQPEKWQDFDPLTLEENSYYKEMESPSGENINMLSGSLTKLTIGMPSSIHELYGGLPSDFNTRMITDDLGVANNRSGMTLDGIMRIIHRTGIYEYAGGVLPNKSFSDIVKRYFAGINNQCAAGTDGTKCYFFIPSDTILVYDPRTQTWSVWKGINATCFAQMGTDFYIGDAQGRVLKLGGTTDAGTPISWYAVTKPFNNDSLARKQRWYKLWIVADVPTGSTLQVFLSRSTEGDSDWEEVTTYMQGSRIIIPVSKFANENFIRIKISGTGPVNIREITRQQRELPLV